MISFSWVFRVEFGRVIYSHASNPFYIRFNSEITGKLKLYTRIKTVAAVTMKTAIFCRVN
jgi:hypothetical protein